MELHYNMHVKEQTNPWDSPGKNTAVGCHCLLQCVKVKSESEVAQSCLTFSNPMDCSLPGSSVRGIFQARVLEWGATAFSYDKLHFTLPSFFFFFLAVPHGVQDLSSPTWDQIHAPAVEQWS